VGLPLRTLDDLRTVAPLPERPQGPIFLDCKINAAIAAPFIGEEFAVFEGRHH
jgi:acetolactate synthase-1/2/3 large subunit